MSVQPAYIYDWNCLTPAGEGFKCIWESLFAGRAFLKDGVGQLPQELVEKILKLRHEKLLRDHDRLTLMGVYLARSLSNVPQSAGLIVGSSRGATESLEASILAHSRGERLKATTSPVTTASGLTSAIARDLQLEGPNLFVSAACSTGLHAVIQGVASLHAQLTDNILVGGVEAANTAYVRALMGATGVTSQGSDDFPCQPMAEGRQGMVLSEGATLIHLGSEPKSASFAIVGVGAANEASTLTGVSPEGTALQNAILKALALANVKSHEVDLIVGHGSGTIKGDESERQAYLRVFDRLPPVVFHKWCVGHMLGASAAMSLGLAMLHLGSGLTSPHPYLPSGHAYREATSLPRRKYALVTSMGFGGSACAVVVKSLSL